MPTIVDIPLDAPGEGEGVDGDVAVAAPPPDAAAASAPPPDADAAAASAPPRDADAVAAPPPDSIVVAVDTEAPDAAADAAADADAVAVAVAPDQDGGDEEAMEAMMMAEAGDLNEFTDEVAMAEDHLVRPTETVVVAVAAEAPAAEAPAAGDDATSDAVAVAVAAVAVDSSSPMEAKVAGDDNIAPIAEVADAAEVAAGKEVDSAALASAPMAAAEAEDAPMEVEAGDDAGTQFEAVASMAEAAITEAADGAEDSAAASAPEAAAEDTPMDTDAAGAEESADGAEDSATASAPLAATEDAPTISEDVPMADVPPPDEMATPVAPQETGDPSEKTAESIAVDADEAAPPAPAAPATQEKAARDVVAEALSDDKPLPPPLPTPLVAPLPAAPSPALVTAVPPAPPSSPNEKAAVVSGLAVAAAAPPVPPPPAAAAVKPSPKPKRSPPLYHAVRVGYAVPTKNNDDGEIDKKSFSVIRSAIFLQWEDVKDFVEFTTDRAGMEARAAAAAAGTTTTADGKSIKIPFHHNVEYKSFESIERAERYLKRVIPALQASSKKSKLKNKKRKAHKKSRTAKTKFLSSRKKSPMPDYPPPKNFNPPTKKWESMYAAAKKYRAERGDLDVCDLVLPPDHPGAEEHEELSKWIKYQRTSYRYYLEDPMGGRHSMTEEKVNRLKEVGFDWIVGDKKRWLAEDTVAAHVANLNRDGTPRRKRGRPRKTAQMKMEEMEAGDEDAAGDGDGNPGGRAVVKNRPIRPKWLGMLQKLKEHKERHGTIEIGMEETDQELVALRQWTKNQRNMHVRWRQGHDVGMTQEKADMLKEIGMEFPPAWEDMYVKIVQYKAQNGDIEITADHDRILAAWMSRQNEVLGRHLQGKSTRLSDDQAMRLLGLGFQGGWGGVTGGFGNGGSSGVTGKSVASRDFDVRWDEMWLKLRDYKNEHGDCNVATSSGTELAHWVAAQRRMYNKLIAGKPGKRACLDAIKMQRLTELGFQFRPRGSYAAWEDQMKGLWKFLEENGHCRIPVNHPTLGSFVKLARRDYKNWTQGKASSMTPERLAALKEVGFIFEGGKSPQRAMGPNKSWDERLEELLIYKTEFGHTVVPQNSGQLGAWVHSQRVHYKKYKEGHKSQMTAEKALKLTEIGFCFNASDRYRGNKRHRTHEQEEEEAAAAEQQIHHQQQQQQQQQHHHYQLQQDGVHVPALHQHQPYM